MSMSLFVAILLSALLNQSCALTIHANFGRNDIENATSSVAATPSGSDKTIGKEMLVQRRLLSNARTHASEQHQAFAQQESHDFPILVHKQKVDPVLVRPNAGKGVDTVHFGLIAKNFFGANLKRNRFTIDIVLSIRWQDPRVVALIPAGLDRMSMAWKQALKLVWMPGIVVANRDIEMYEIMSSSVTIFRSGEVLRVERALARCMKKYWLQEYPFDLQNLTVEIVSSKYMMHEVVLEPNVSSSSVEEHVWGLYTLVGWHVRTFKDVNGHLKKSRGALEITVDRSLQKYFDDHLIPSFIVLTISWAVFYFPFANPFITPRLALSILALLTFTNLMLKSIKELPGPAPFNWNDLLNQQIQAMMFMTIIINICAEIVYHQLHMEESARAMNNEAKVLLPATGIVSIGIILGSGRFGWMSIFVATYVTKAFLLLVIIFYGLYCIWAMTEISNKPWVRNVRSMHFTSRQTS